jgi:hypothetical protein
VHRRIDGRPFKRRGDKAEVHARRTGGLLITLPTDPQRRACFYDRRGWGQADAQTAVRQSHSVRGVVTNVKQYRAKWNRQTD